MSRFICVYKIHPKNLSNHQTVRFIQYMMCFCPSAILHRTAIKRPKKPKGLPGMPTNGNSATKSSNRCLSPFSIPIHLIVRLLRDIKRFRDSRGAIFPNIVPLHRIRMGREMGMRIKIGLSIAKLRGMIWWSRMEWRHSRNGTRFGLGVVGLSPKKLEKPRLLGNLRRWFLPGALGNKRFSAS